MNTNIINILQKINIDNTIRFTGWSPYFIEDIHWPYIMEFMIDSYTFNDNTMTVNLIEKEHSKYSCSELLNIFKSKKLSNIKFLFNNIEVIPVLGNNEYSDKICFKTTQINFEPK